MQQTYTTIYTKIMLYYKQKRKKSQKVRAQSLNLQTYLATALTLPRMKNIAEGDSFPDNSLALYKLTDYQAILFILLLLIENNEMCSWVNWIISNRIIGIGSYEL